MALTTLTVPRRNVVALHFDQTTNVPGPLTPQAYSHSIYQHPYPVFVGFSVYAQPVTAGVPGEGSDFSYLAINSSQNEFGTYYPGDPFGKRTVNNGGSSMAMLRDNATITNMTVGPVEVPDLATFTDMPVSLTAFALGDPPYPPDDQVTIDSGESFATAATPPVYNIGGSQNQQGFLTRNISDEHFLYERDGTKWKAFTTDADFRPRNAITLNDGDYNYTWHICSPVSGSGLGQYLTRWTAQSTAGSFSETFYAVELDDATDDAAFQAGLDVDTPDYAHMNANYENFWFVIADYWSDVEQVLTSMTVFFFAKDFTWYDRYDITADGALSFGNYRQDPAGNHFLAGRSASTGEGAFQFLAGDGGGGGEVDEDIIIRAWGASLDDHDKVYFRLGDAGTLVYDISTGQWTEYASPGLEYWRPHIGMNWAGMGATTAARGFGTNIVCADDTEGVLYIIDPTLSMDDDPTTGTPAAFSRKFTGLVTTRGRDTINCNAVQLTASLGNPAVTGASVTLRTSDDGGFNWTSHGSVTVSAASYNQVIEWRALGLIKHPGRLFEFTDSGALARVSGADMR